MEDRRRGGGRRDNIGLHGLAFCFGELNLAGEVEMSHERLYDIVDIALEKLLVFVVTCTDQHRQDAT